MSVFQISLLLIHSSSEILWDFLLYLLNNRLTLIQNITGIKDARIRAFPYEMKVSSIITCGIGKQDTLVLFLLFECIRIFPYFHLEENSPVRGDYMCSYPQELAQQSLIEDERYRFFQSLSNLPHQQKILLVQYSHVQFSGERTGVLDIHNMYEVIFQEVQLDS